jgi:hypothetical protein
MNFRFLLSFISLQRKKQLLLECAVLISVTERRNEVYSSNEDQKYSMLPVPYQQFHIGT